MAGSAALAAVITLWSAVLRPGLEKNSRVWVGLLHADPVMVMSRDSKMGSTATWKLRRWLSETPTTFLARASEEAEVAWVTGTSLMVAFRLPPPLSSVPKQAERRPAAARQGSMVFQA